MARSSEFLSAEESEALIRSLPKPTPGDCLERFIWEFESGSVKDFAAKVGYHPNRISALKSATRGISPRLFRRMVEAYKLGRKEREFWGKRLLGI
jgi:plasmid maintenance system antidote protein VapI